MSVVPDLDIAPSIRRTILAAPIAAHLSLFNGRRAVFTRRPVPDEAEFPLVIINPDSAVSDDDGLNSERPVIVRDIVVYGRKGQPGTPGDQTRVVESIGWAIRQLFHRQKFSVRAPGFSAIEVTATGPIAAPVDDEGTIGRMVRLTVRLRRGE